MDLRAVHPKAHGFYGAVYDGRYVYLVPSYNITGPEPVYVTGTVVVRYDTTGPFDAGSSYSFADLSKLNSAAGGYVGGTFDGRYVYLSPNARFMTEGSPRQVRSGLVARYDTHQPFIEPTAWDFFDLAALTRNAVGFHGGAFDGRYVYLATHGTRWMQTALIARYDTRASFADRFSWTVWDWTGEAGIRGPRGVVYFGGSLFTVPNYNGAYSGVILQVPVGK